MFVEKFATIPEIAKLGPLFKSSQPVELTESETEYVVRCVKHIFTDHMVLQFDCTNTLNDQLLENVYVQARLSSLIRTAALHQLALPRLFHLCLQLEVPAGFEIVHVIPCPRLEYNVNGVCYVILATVSMEDLSMLIGTLSPTLKFVVKDCDPNTGEPDTDDG